jgi:hypothetical protein
VSDVVVALLTVNQKARVRFPDTPQIMRMLVFVTTISNQADRPHQMQCPGGETGRHKGLKIPRLWRAGSTPARGTKEYIPRELIRTSVVLIRQR